MTIAPTVGELVPGWVYEGKFPEGDEAALAELGQAWTQQAESNTSDAEELGHAMEALAETYSGPAARAANQSAEKTRTWLESGAEACTSLGEACAAASVLIMTTKVAMNVVLLSLQVSTQKILKADGGNVLDVAAKLIKIRQIQIAAQAQIDALSRALVTKLGELKPEVDIKPSLPKPKNLSLPGLDNGTGPIGYADGPEGSQVGGNVPTEDGFPDVSDIVGTDEATEAMDANGTTPGMSPGVGGANPEQEGLYDASNQALSEEERDELYDEAMSTLEEGDTGDYSEQDLAEHAEQIDPDDIPETVYDSTPGNGTVPGDDEGMSTEQILGEDPTQRPDPVIPNEEFEGGGPGLGVDDGPPAPVYDGPPPTSDPGIDDRPSPSEDSTPDPTPSRPAPVDPPPGQQPGSGERTPWYPPPPQPDAPTYPSGDSGGHGSGGHGSGGGPPHPSPPPSYVPPAPVEGAPVAPPQEPGTSGAGVAPTAPVGNPGGGPGAAPPPSTGFNPGPGAGNHLGGSGLGGSGLGGSGLGGGTGVGGGVSGGFGGSAPAPSGPAVGGGGVTPPPTSVPPTGSAPPPSSVPGAGQPGTAVPPTGTPPGATPPASTPPASSSQPGQPVPAKEIRVPESRAALAGGDPGATPPGADRTDAIGALIGAGLMAGGLGLAALWADLGRPTPSTGPGATGERYLPTQFGREDVPLAALPAGMAETYQRTLVPGEAEAFLSGVITTVRGLIHPYDQIRDLQTPAALFDALGLGFGVLTATGSSERVFDRDAGQVEVIRFNGVRPEDLVVPVAPDVVPPEDATIPYVVRQHAEPWTGSGEAPGSTLDQPIEEYEILGTASVAIPHLAEIWRIGADGEESHLATFNARSGAWTGMAAPQQFPGRVLENGLYAQTPDGMTYRMVTLTETEHVLIAHGLAAPEYFLPAEDGSARWITQTEELVALMGVTTLATWQGARVQVLRRNGEHCLIDHADPTPAHAAALGFRQLNQGQWAPQWVEYADLSDHCELERTYPLPEPAEHVEEILSGRPVAPPPAPRPAAG